MEGLALGSSLLIFLSRVKMALTKRSAKKRSRALARLAKKYRQTYAPYQGIRGTNPTNVVRVRGIGMPDRLITNLVYSDNKTVTPGAGSLGFFVMRMTSVFDPDEAVGGGQPTYHDQIAAMYKRYRVLGAKITAHFSYPTGITAGIGPAICGIQSSDVNTIPSTDVGGVISLPNTSYAMLSPNGDPVTVVATYSAKNTYPGQEMDLTASTGANPVLNWLAKVFVGATAGSDTTAVQCVFIIEYSVEYSDLVQVVDV